MIAKSIFGSAFGEGWILGVSIVAVAEVEALVS